MGRDDAQLEVFFRAVDADNSGSIDVAELRDALASGNLIFDTPVVSQMIKLFDRDQNGTMSFQEFVSLHKLLSMIQSSFDKYASGRDFLELKKVYLALQDMGYMLDEPAFYIACQSFDRNQSGKFQLGSYVELCIFLQSARNLFGAFDVQKQGRVSLDFNQFIYCGGNMRL